MNSKTPRQVAKQTDNTSDNSNDNLFQNDYDSIKLQIRSKNKTLGELTNSVNSLAKKKGKLRSEIQHLIISKNSFFEGLTRIRKIMLSQKHGSILQYFSEHNTGLVLYEWENDIKSQEGSIMRSSSPVPPVKHESEIKPDKKGVSMTQWLVEIEKYIKFVHGYFSEFEHCKNIDIFEKEVEELSKSWEMLKEEKKLVEQTKQRLKVIEAERNFNIQKNYNFSKKENITLREPQPNYTELGDQSNQLNKFTSMSVKNFQHPYSTCAITEDDRFREYPHSRNNHVMKEISDLKTKYESLRERLDCSDWSSIHEESQNDSEKLKETKLELTREIQELNSIRGQAIKLREEIHSLKTEIPTLKDNKEGLQTEIRKLKREKEIIKEDIMSYHERSQVLNKRYESQENTIKDEIKTIQRKIEEKNAQLDNTIQREHDIELRIFHKNEELTNINHKIRLATEEFDLMNQKIKENSWIDMEIENKNRILNLVDTKMGIREEELKEAENKLISIRKIAEEYSNRCNETKIKNKKLHEEIRHFEKLISIKKEELNDLEEVVKHKIEGKNELANIIIQREGQLKSVEDELAEKQDWVDKFQVAIEKLLNDMSQFTTKYEREKVDKSNEIIYLQRELEKLKKKHRKMTSNMTVQTHRINNNSMLKDREEYKSLRGELKNMQQVISQAHTDYNLKSTPEHWNCFTRRETEEKLYELKTCSQEHFGSDFKYQDNSFEEIDKKFSSKPQSSMDKIENPYISHLRTASAGGLAIHHRRVSEPMSLKYFKQARN
jgi:hypothetical protein